MKAIEMYIHNEYLIHNINSITVCIQIVYTYLLAANWLPLRRARSCCATKSTPHPRFPLDCRPPQPLQSWAIPAPICIMRMYLIMNSTYMPGKKIKAYLAEVLRSSTSQWAPLLNMVTDVVVEYSGNRTWKVGKSTCQNSYMLNKKLWSTRIHQHKIPY